MMLQPTEEALELQKMEDEAKTEEERKKQQKNREHIGLSSLKNIKIFHLYKDTTNQ